MESGLNFFPNFERIWYNSYMSESAFMKFKTLLVVFCIAAAAALILYNLGVFKKSTQPAQNENTSQNPSPSQEQPATSTSPSGQTSETNTPSIFAAPIENWQSRVTKKLFGIYITPANSPVQPEKFTGYHTGIDFETFQDEQNIDVPIYAICDGSLKVKERASGYGGVAVQACRFENQDITIIYGHVRLSSIAASVGQNLSAGEKFAVLGTGFSQETDGERKHLHLGIHKGAAINIVGYVQNLSQLDNWIDVTKYLK